MRRLLIIAAIAVSAVAVVSTVGEAFLNQGVLSVSSQLPSASLTCTSPSPCTIVSGSSVTLAWTSNQPSCTSPDIPSFPGTGSGSTTVSPTATTIYHLTCGTASASATVTVTSGAGCGSNPSGALPGSILPPGTWCNALDEEFTGTSLSANWSPHNGGVGCCGGVSYCEASGAIVFNNPGLSIYSLPVGYAGSSGPVGCVITNTSASMQQYFTTPGYIEAKILSDYSGGNPPWTGIFFEVGPNPSSPSCNHTPASAGSEMDLFETVNGTSGTFNMYWNDYSGCGSAANQGAIGTYNDTYHLWGMDWGDNNAVTIYKDGTQMTQFTFSDGVEPGNCNASWADQYNCTNGNWNAFTLLMDYSPFNGGSTTSSGIHFAWIRTYYHPSSSPNAIVLGPRAAEQPQLTPPLPQKHGPQLR